MPLHNPAYCFETSRISGRSQTSRLFVLPGLRIAESEKQTDMNVTSKRLFFHSNEGKLNDKHFDDRLIRLAAYSLLRQLIWLMSRQNRILWTKL